MKTLACFFIVSGVVAFVVSAVLASRKWDRSQEEEAGEGQMSTAWLERFRASDGSVEFLDRV